MKREFNKRYPFQIWLTTTLFFPSMYILYHLMEWKKEQFSVLGVLYLFLFAVIISGVLTLPSFALLELICGRLTRNSISTRFLRILAILFSITTMFVTLTCIDFLLYPLHKNFWLIGIFYAFCVTTSSLIFEPVEQKKEAPVSNSHQKVFWRLLFPYRLWTPRQS
jgi:TM2 domain-containing membrane protein YozV